MKGESKIKDMSAPILKGVVKLAGGIIDAVLPGVGSAIGETVSAFIPDPTLGRIESGISRIESKLDGVDKTLRTYASAIFIIGDFSC